MPKKTPVAAVPELVVTEVVVETKAFSEAELFYINAKCQDTPPEEIAETLGCSVNDVLPHIPQASAEDQQRKKTMFHSLMGNSTVGGRKGRTGPAVMTPAASQVSDETRGQRVNINGRSTECIHKPLG